MRLIFGFVLAFTPLDAWAYDDFSTKQGCLAAMSHEVGIAQASQRIPEIKKRYLENAPSSAHKHVSAVISAYEEIARQYQIIAEGLFAICGEYD